MCVVRRPLRVPGLDCRFFYVCCHCPVPCNENRAACCAGRCEFQDLIARYDVRDVLPKLKSYSHEWDAEVQVGAESACVACLLGTRDGTHLTCASVQVSAVPCHYNFTATSSLAIPPSQQADDGYHDSTSKALTLDLEK